MCSGAMIVTSCWTTVLTRHAQLAVAALLAGEIDDHRSGSHRLHGFRIDQPRRRLAGNERGGDDDIGLESTLVNELPLALDVLLAQLFRVAAGILRLFRVHVELDEGRAQTLYLLLDDRSRVESFDDGADAAGGRDRLQVRRLRRR